jgi:hypothetical protein
MENPIFWITLLGVLGLIFAIASGRLKLSVGQMLEMLAVLGLLPTAILLLDRFVAPGLWEKMVIENAIEYWLARLAYFMAIGGIAFKARLWLPTASIFMVILILCLAVSELRPKPKQASASMTQNSNTGKPTEEEVSTEDLSAVNNVWVNELTVGESKTLIFTAKNKFKTIYNNGCSFSVDKQADLLWVDPKTKAVIDTVRIGQPFDFGNNSALCLTPLKKLAPGERVVLGIKRISREEAEKIRKRVRDLAEP